MDGLGPFGELLGEYGPLAMVVLLFASGVGIPISEETVNIPAGILVGQGTMPALPVFIAAYIGVLGGDFLWFGLCRHFGKRLLHQRWFRKFVHPRRLLEAKHGFDRRGGSMLILARFIPGSRSPALTISALLRMSWGKFILIEFLVCLITVPLQVLVGYLIGRELAGTSLKTALFTGLGVIAVIIALTAVLNWWRLSRKRTGRAPRARQQWLRGEKRHDLAKNGQHELAD